MIIIYQHNIIYLLDRSNAQLTSYSIKSTSTPYYYELFPQLFSTLRHFIQFFLQATLAASQKIHPLPVLPSIFQHNLLLFHGAIGPILCVQKSPFLSPHFRFQCHLSLDFFSDGSVCSCSCQRHFHHFPPTLQFKEVVTIRHETCFHDTIEIKLKPVFRTFQPILCTKQLSVRSCCTNHKLSQSPSHGISTFTITIIRPDWVVLAFLSSKTCQHHMAPDWPRPLNV